ncbi:hypothetical protein BWZ20_09485 [Winogradskyella sp. J14-2]|uniref:hypothetical protein n=1 Tax=Winogradskyella sp. J14-2 TaxID=1936080 RepID=UPI000972711A|nr:hypothetical protein [Winogradskyella sp. J14-2]APY08518.1 hypothetical protein BWZ20_09485 [Winogradskyella sp. J14-2]
MKNLKKAIYAIVFTFTLSSFFQCASPKVATTNFEQQTPFTVKSVVFQEWYAGIKVGGTGINIFVPVSNVNDNVVLKDVYFRNLKGKLIKTGNKYTAVLKNPSQNYTFHKAEKPAGYPFDLKDNECVISYSENGQTKYHKIVSLSEVAGTYYENGPPSIYSRGNSNSMATLDDDLKDN